jgi:pyruvate carboxylase subunit B
MRAEGGREPPYNRAVMPRLALVEASLRFGQQALLVSRLRQRHAVRAAELLDACGFAALEVFGGATFEAQVRFLGEDPFERLRAIRAAAPTTPLMATLAGQMLVAHRHQPDDVVESFIRLGAEAGIDVFRLLDPLNDPANLEVPARAAKAAGSRVEGVVVCTPAPAAALAAMGKTLADLGCDSVCIHDPIGGVGAARAAELVEAVAATSGLPVSVSFTAHTGEAALAYHAANAAGAASADVCVSPLAGGASFPTAEAVVAGLAGTEGAAQVELDSIFRVAHFIEEIAPLYADLIDPAVFRFDGAALRGMLPTSAMGHALAELRERGAVNRLADVEAEILRVRRELGDPPPISPFPELIAIQAVHNVFEGDRYATLSQEIKDYCLGLFGTPPAPIDPEVRHLVNGREEPITCRPADLLEPGLPGARRELQREGLPADPEKIVTFALFGSELSAFLRGEAIAERLTDEPESPAAEEEAGGPVGAAPADPAEPGQVEVAEDVRALRVEVDGQTYEVRIFGGGAQAAPEGTAPAPRRPPRVRDGTVTSPMQGLILKVTVEEGDTVEIGDVVAVLEAMKMQNDVTATRAGRVTAIHVKPGDVVAPQTPIVDIG